MELSVLFQIMRSRSTPNGLLADLATRWCLDRRRRVVDEAKDKMRVLKLNS